MAIFKPVTQEEIYRRQEVVLSELKSVFPKTFRIVNGFIGMTMNEHTIDTLRSAVLYAVNEDLSECSDTDQYGFSCNYVFVDRIGNRIKIVTDSFFSMNLHYN